jgi:hypothetical protein
MVWNHFMQKLGWRDDRTPILKQRIVEFGLTNAPVAIDTFFDLNDVDEGRNPVANQSWLG